MNSKRLVFWHGIQRLIKYVQGMVYRRQIIRLILLVLLGLTTTLIPVLRPQSVARPSETISPSNAQSLMRRGIELYEAERFSDAAATWQQAKSAFDSLNDNLAQALVLSNLSSTYLQLGQWQAAQRTIAQSFELLQSKDGATQTHREILAKALNAQGNLQWETGQSEEALSTWREAMRHYMAVGHSEGIVMTKINQSKALQALGLSRQAEETLQQVYQTLQQSDPDLKATGLRHLGNAYRRVGKLHQSQQVLAEGLKLAKGSTSKRSTLLELGNTERALGSRALVIGKNKEAQAHTQTAIQFYQQAASDSNGLQAQLNQLSLLVATGQWSAAEALWPKIQQAIANTPASRATIYALLNFAQSLMKLVTREDGHGDTVYGRLAESSQQGRRDEVQRISPSPPLPLPLSPSPHPEQSFSPSSIAPTLATAVQHAKSLQDHRAESYALGQLGELYELTGQWSDAQDLTQQALFLVEQFQAPDIRYRWEWQLGRLLEKQGDIKGAIAAYTRAIEVLESVRQDLLTVSSEIQFSFRDNVQPIYRGLVDLLLRTEGTAQPGSENLKQAIREIDALQLAELENFLGCNLSALKPIEQIPNPKAAIIYPIILKDRIAIISELPSQQSLGYQETQVSQGEVEQTLRALRDNLIVPGNTPEVLTEAQKVYQWIVQPLEPFLKQSQVETLVFVLDGDLRNVPMAALYDGDRYLIEKYGIAVAPRVKLFSPRPSEQRLYVQTGGVDTPQTIDGTTFPAIEKLTEELERIAQKTRASKPLVNADFTKAKIQQQLQTGNFSAIHWKTHGVFSSDPEETYIAAYNERLLAQDLNSLLQTGSQTGAQPLELLVLSACETARGDDRAVLGLAGIAVRTGARSVVSTLWVAKDAPNTEFMARFYEELSKPGVTKAQAVRQAQLALLKEYGYTTPYIWATYTLVGNWL